MKVIKMHKWEFVFSVINDQIVIPRSGCMLKIEVH